MSHLLRAKSVWQNKQWMCLDGVWSLPPKSSVLLAHCLVWSLRLVSCCKRYVRCVVVQLTSYGVVFQQMKVIRFLLFVSIEVKWKFVETSKLFQKRESKKKFCLVEELNSSWKFCEILYDIVLWFVFLWKFSLKS